MTRLASAIMVVILCVSAPAHEGATGIVKERMDAMKALGALTKDMADKIKGNRNLPSLSADADAIIATADRIPAWFPAGSAQKPTEAAPAIWTDPEGFAASAVAMRKMAEALKVKVEAGEPAGIAAQFRLLAQSCKSCHQGYRIIPK